jgi:DNA polymerase-4
MRGRTVTLKVKFANFQVITRSRTGQMQVRTRGELEELGNALLEPLFPLAKGIRLLGISLFHWRRRRRNASRNSACLLRPGLVSRLK